ncbi:cytochrome P450 [Mycolicibacterium sp. ELW1]|uniref:cytochrome P450 n=1 Tax=Mycobacteriaceae TaxID=1762 RepID=UPI0011EDE625|nr:cytochrome P450 [Mycobacterium sp. ELW1]QEN12961.1 cytochrome P450 [Mycobacterium sp. ELW1]
MTSSADVDELARKFDHHSSDYARDPWSINHALVQQCPVAHSEQHGGFWYVTGYEEVRQVAMDDKTFSARHDLPNGSTAYEGISLPGYPMRTGFIETDPPLSTAWRKPFNRYFSMAAAEAMRPQVRRYASWCLDQKIESGEMDLVLDYSGPVPAIVTLKLVGLPTDDWKTFSDASHRIVSLPPDSPERAQAMADHAELFAQIPEIAAKRRSDPRDDLITVVTQMELEGAPPSTETLVETILLLVQGGVDTTSNLVGHALRYLAEHPLDRQRLIDDPTRIPAAIEEFLRFYSPVQTIARTATRDTELGGCPIREGDRLLVSWAGANLDERVWADPLKVVLDRKPNRQTSFGIGVHRCLGANLANVMIEEMLAEVLQRIPDYQITGPVSSYATIGIIHGIEALPVRFRAGHRIAEPGIELRDLDDVSSGQRRDGLRG